MQNTAKVRCKRCDGKRVVTKNTPRGYRTTRCDECKGTGWVGIAARRRAPEGHLTDDLPLITK